MRKVKTGIVGYGKSAKVFHIPFLSIMDEFEITAVLERRGEESKKQLPRINVLADHIEAHLLCFVYIINKGFFSGCSV